MKPYIALSFVLLLFSCGKKDTVYETFEVTKKDLIRKVEANGMIESLNTINIVTPVPGRIEKVLVKENDTVRAGQKIMALSSDSRNSILEMAMSKGPKEVEYWKGQMLLTPIFAPVSGKIISLQDGQGMRVSGAVGQVSTGEIVRANLDEGDLPEVSVGQKVEIFFDIDSKKSLSGTLEKISATSKMVNNINMYQVEVSLPEPEKRKKIPFDIKIGMSVTLYFQVSEKKSVLALPLDSVQGRSRANVTVILEDESRAKVRLGDTFDEWVEVTSGLKEGDKIKVPAFRVKKAKERSSPLMMK